MRLHTSPKDPEGRRPHQEGMEDMIKLQVLTEDSLLRNIKVRYERELIYTYTGSILVAVNPYRMFNIYGRDMVKLYEGQVMGSQPPHLFAIGSSAFSKMIRDNQNQVIVISGESGAGKTESTKLILQYLAAVDKSMDNLITQQILEASPLLESFGNAKTIRNDNSSRFGKYVEVYFKGGSIVGAKTSEYLLEKSRIAKQAEDERNYHVFYEMLVGLSGERKKGLGLTTPDKYFFLNQGRSCQIPTKDDAADFGNLQSAMEVLGLTHKEQDTIFKILASILHMGNIFFQRKQNIHHHEGVEMGSDAEVKWVSHLLDLSKDWLHEGLTMKVTEARRERLLTPLTIDQALDARDGISKALYQRLFTWLVERVNQIVAGESRARQRATSIALLDIFGFEDFHVNSFEQLCINYANETLQFYFNKHIFKLEQAEYAREKIDWTVIDFQDNQPTIDLIAKKPHGIVHILDDESNFPKATDASFLEKCHRAHDQSVLYHRPRLAAGEFTIQHYAGRVSYNVSGFLDKNRDTLRSDVMEMMIKSRNVIISQMFRGLRESTLNRTVAKQGFYVPMRSRTPTVAAAFHESLVSLVATMSRCQPWFVRCIKPNNRKAPMRFNSDVVLTQLRYTGMLQTIRIRKMGYPIRYHFRDFADRFHVLLEAKPRPHQQWTERQMCERILHRLGPTWKNAWQTGYSKVFLKEALSNTLETEKTAIMRRKVLLLQKNVRGFLARKEYRRKRRAAIKLQAGIRALVARSQYNRMREGFIKTQAQYRMIQQRKAYLQMREEARRQERSQQHPNGIDHVEAPAGRKEVKRGHSGRPSPLKRSRLEIYEPKTLRSISPRELRQRQERMAGSEINVNSLEVPVDLAYVFSKLSDVPPPHSDSHVTQVTDHVVPRDMKLVLPDDIDAYSFNKYVNIYFKERLQMKREPITSPFLAKIQDSDAKESVVIFKLILRYMNDASLSLEREKAIADYVVQRGIANVSLRDEIYAQLAAQTWLNQNEANCARGWHLMMHALAAFPPSDNLCKYLLKFVSDQAPDQYKSYTQHLLMHGLTLLPPNPRYYPPSYLEWRAAKDHSQMALPVVFPDGKRLLGHVGSWTTGEEFGIHLLRQREASEGDHGWTVALIDANHTYELMGLDYVLDLVGEMEVPRGFPHVVAPFVVTTDHTRETPPDRRKLFQSSPHSPEAPRLVERSTEILTTPVPVSPRPAPDPRQFFRSFSRDNLAPEDSLSMPSLSRYASQEGLGLSQTSRLNSRALREQDENALSGNSLLNVRYIGGTMAERTAGSTSGRVSSTSESLAPPGGGAVGTGSGPPSRRTSAMSSGSVPAEVGLSTSRLNNRYAKSPTSPTSPTSPAAPLPMSSDPQALALASSSKLNQRYSKQPTMVNGNETGNDHQSQNGGLSNGHVGSGSASDIVLSDSKLNRRGPRGGATSPPSNLAGPSGGGLSSKDQIHRRQRAESGRHGDDRASVKSGQLSEIDKWLDGVFNPILDGTVDDLSDPSAVQTRLKGGGQGVPGMTSQPGPYTTTVMTGGIPPIIASGNVTTVPTFSAPATGSIPIGPIPILQDPNQAIAQQLAAQQQQALLTHQQAQQAQLTAQVLHQENQELQNQLVKKDLEKQVLEKTLEAERLNSQLKEMASGRPAPTTNTTPTIIERQPSISTTQSRPRSASPLRGEDASRPADSVVMRDVRRQPPSGPPGGVRANARGASGEIDTSRPGGVKTLKSKYEKSVARPLSPTLFRKEESPSDGTSGESTSPRVHFSENDQHIPSVSSPPASATKPTSPQTSSPTIIKQPGDASPPPPPPLLPVPVTVNRSSGGEARSVEEPVVRVGTIQWPPPEKETEKPNKMTPNRLVIEQNVIPQPTKPGARSTKDAHQDLIDAIRARNQEVAPEPPKPQPQKPPTKINMEERKLALAKQLSQVGVLKGRIAEDTPSQRPRSPLPPPPPPPPPPAPVHISRQESNLVQDPEPESLGTVAPPVEVEKDEDRTDDYLKDLSELEKIRTRLFSGDHGPYLTYSRVPWTLEVRKEVFTPTEILETPALVHLVFCQIVQDVFSNACIRIPKEERTRTRSMLENQGITPRSMHTHHNIDVKRHLIDTSRDWPIYFARLFPVDGGQRHPSVQVVGVSHSGVKLLTRDKDIFEDALHVVDHFRFADIIDVSEPKSGVLQVHANNDYFILYTPRAREIMHMISAYCIESEKNVMYVRAIKDYLTRDPTLLRFHEGDIIKLTNQNMALDKGWLYGSLYGRTGLFPEEYVKPLARHELEKYESGPKRLVPSGPPASSSSSSSSSGENPLPSPRKDPYKHRITREDIYSDASIYSVMPQVQKFSMLEFAMLHFRESPFRYEMLRSEETGSIHGTFKMISSLKAKTMQRQQSKKRASLELNDSDTISKRSGKDWTWKEQADMIKWTKSPIQASLLKFESPQMNKLALECFVSIMKYMGDYPLSRGQKPIDCVYTILKICYNNPEIRDEVYCQVAKQTTNNRSTRLESVQLGWRLMCIITAYFDCTDIFKPYLFKYLETTGLDLQRPHQALAAQSLLNIRQTFRYGGRKNVPSRVELEALTRGRNTKRQMCVMPGGMPVILNIRSCSVVADAIDQICQPLDIQDPLERDEFSIFYVIESGSRYLTLNRDEYIFDITTELTNQKKEFYLLFQRTSWVFPLHLDNNTLYMDVMYHQCIPDYLDGFLLPMPTVSLPEHVKSEIARLGALQIQASELKNVPQQRDILAVVPRTAQGASGTSWINLIERELHELQQRNISAARSKVLFLEIISRWPLFGSTFFNIKSVTDPRVKGECLLAINRSGVHFLHPSTYETQLAYSFSQVVSTRRYRSKEGKNYLEMKVGDLMHQKVTRIETDQGVDISALIGQYIHILKKCRQ